jgi:hypothetical protein
MVKKLKNKNDQFKNKNVLPKRDVEFAGENGLEKIALRAQKKSK